MMKTILIWLLSLLPMFAFGLGGPICSPSIGYRADIGEDAKKKVMEVYAFMNNQLEFIEGSFINEYSNQSFKGTSENVAKLASLLEEAGQWNVHVQFRDFGEEETACSMDQNTRTNTVRVMVNSGRTDFKLHHFKAWLPKPGLPTE